MTTAEVLRRPPSLSALFGQMFRNPQRNRKTSGNRKGALSPANRFETAYDETKPFFMQQNWRR